MIRSKNRLAIDNPNLFCIIISCNFKITQAHRFKKHYGRSVTKIQMIIEFFHQKPQLIGATDMDVLLQSTLT